MAGVTQLQDAIIPDIYELRPVMFPHVQQLLPAECNVRVFLADFFFTLLFCCKSE